MTGWMASSSEMPAVMNAPRITSAPMMPNMSTRCWKRAGITNAEKMAANRKCCSRALGSPAGMQGRSVPRADPVETVSIWAAPPAHGTSPPAGHY
jgi:hypothetical protein